MRLKKRSAVILSAQAWCCRDGWSMRRGRLLLALLLTCLAVAIARAASADDSPATAAAGTAPPVRSTCGAKCFLHGSCNEELGRCDCLRGWRGADCTEALSGQELKRVCVEQGFGGVSECRAPGDTPCLNACNHRGKCVHGVCHCPPGTWGADCALSLGPDGKPALLVDQGYRPRVKRPWVYVYELPPEFTTWSKTRRMDRPLHLLLWQRLLSSGARTADVEAADWFFLPLRMRSKRDSALAARAVAYVNRTWPHALAQRRDRHFALHLGDLGMQEVQASVRQQLAGFTWVTHWGLREDVQHSQWQAAHRPLQDVVIPVWISPHHFARFGLQRSPLHPKYTEQARRPPPRNGTLLFFAGRICGDREEPRTDGRWPNCGSEAYGYSKGVRQAVHYHHWNRSGFVVRTRVGAYDRRLATSTFCLAPPGGGHGQRQVLVSFMGCIPVCIGDGISQPYEPQLNWARFSLLPPEAQVPRLHEVLGAVPPAQVADMQRALRCAAQHFVWSGIAGGFMGETGQFDAFETLLEILRVKAKFPRALPQELQDLDADFKTFMQCGSTDSMGGALDLAWAARQGPRFLAAANGSSAPLCSHSYLDAPKGEPTCYKCMRGTSNTHGVPGGMMCCGRRHKLAHCPRVWD